jgi:hypothetical protein
VFEPRRLGSIDMVQAFGDLAISLGGKGNECEIMF